MGKSRKPKPYTKMDAIRKYTRLLEDSEFMSPQEITDRKQRIRVVMGIKDQELRQQEKEERERGYCPICHCLNTLSGNCGNGCVQKGSRL